MSLPITRYWYICSPFFFEKQRVINSLILDVGSVCGMVVYKVEKSNVLCCCKHTEIYKLFVFKYPHLINTTSRKAGIMIYLEIRLDRVKLKKKKNLKQEFSLLRRFFFPISPTKLLTDLAVWVTWWMAFKKHELLTLLRPSRTPEFTPGF